ncbi:MAG TPA: hypothetical protein VHI52_00150, partial [Verrucomicrobiae bacterium]|nr:hypothetical protein [Verrucomicrobiae bacterium]
TTSAAGEQLEISYILNEPATAGVEIDILNGASVVKRITDAGTNRGLNSVSWTNDLPSGTYQVSITATSTGYTNWTQITSEDDPGVMVWLGRGISVDRNPGSPYYGRIFVANSDVGPSPDTNPGDNVGVLKLNADASFADEGASSAGLDGHDWTGNQISPWNLQVSDDEFVYVDDLALSGQVFRWDPLMSSNSLAAVLRADNIPSGAILSGPAVVGAGTNTQIWMADTASADGILRWLVATNGLCATNDLGKTIVGVGTDPTNGLSMSPISVSVDGKGNIYTCQAITNAGDPTARVFRFPAYNPATNGGAPELIADWAVGENDDSYASASGIAVDPTGTYVAVSFQGLVIDSLFQGGNTKVLYATNGAVAANLDLGLAIGLDANHQDTGCGWDAVGNVYCIDNWFGKWRAFSPPGTNQSTTVAVPALEVTGGTVTGPPPTITKLTFTGGAVTIDFTATTSDTPASFLIIGSASVVGPYSTIPGAVITQISPGVFRATLTATANMQYFRIQRQGGSVPPSGQAPQISNLVLSNGTALLTFTASTDDSASQFTLLSASTAGGPFTPAAGASVTKISSGVFRASVPAVSPIQFYRLQR